MVTVRSPLALEFACRSAACAPHNGGGSLPSGAYFPGTPGYEPRKMSQAQASAEISEAIRDSENHGYDIDQREAAEFLDAFNTMRLTGKSVPYGNPRFGQKTVEPGETVWHTKLDYEMSVPADTVAAFLGRPLKEGSYNPLAKASPAASPAQAAWSRQKQMLIPVKGSLKVKAGVAHLDGKPITGKISKRPSGMWSARVRNAEKSYVEASTQTEVSRQAARLVEGSVPAS
jgi:hypothetical protein